MMGIDTKTYTFDLNLSMSSIKLITKKSSNNAIEVRVHLIQRYWLHEVYTLRKARSEENVAEEFEEKKHAYTYKHEIEHSLAYAINVTETKITPPKQ